MFEFEFHGLFSMSNDDILLSNVGLTFIMTSITVTSQWLQSVTHVQWLGQWAISKIYQDAHISLRLYCYEKSETHISISVIVASPVTWESHHVVWWDPRVNGEAMVTSILASIRIIYVGPCRSRSMLWSNNKRKWLGLFFTSIFLLYCTQT